MSNSSFYVDQPVRVTDLNYGKHLGMPQLLGMAHNARMCFLTAHGLTESDIGGCGVMLLETNAALKTESFFGETLRFFVEIKLLSRTQFECCATVRSADDDKLVATVSDKMIAFDYTRRKPCAIPDGLKQHAVIEQIETA